MQWTKRRKPRLCLQHNFQWYSDIYWSRDIVCSSKMQQIRVINKYSFWLIYMHIMVNQSHKRNSKTYKLRHKYIHMYTNWFTFDIFSHKESSVMRHKDNEGLCGKAMSNNI